MSLVVPVFIGKLGVLLIEVLLPDQMVFRVSAIFDILIRFLRYIRLFLGNLFGFRFSFGFGLGFGNGLRRGFLFCCNRCGGFVLCA